MRRILYLAMALSLAACAVEAGDPDNVQDIQEDEFDLTVGEQAEAAGSPGLPQVLEWAPDPAVANQSGEPHGPTPYPWVTDSTPSGPTPYPWEGEHEGTTNGGGTQTEGNDTQSQGPETGTNGAGSKGQQTSGSGG